MGGWPRGRHGRPVKAAVQGSIVQRRPCRVAFYRTAMHAPPELRSRQSEGRPHPTQQCCRWSGRPHAPEGAAAKGSSSGRQQTAAAAAEGSSSKGDCSELLGQWPGQPPPAAAAWKGAGAVICRAGGPAGLRLVRQRLRQGQSPPLQLASWPCSMSRMRVPPMEMTSSSG